jgi:hypothetical protein
MNSHLSGKTKKGRGKATLFYYSLIIAVIHSVFKWNLASLLPVPEPAAAPMQSGCHQQQKKHQWKPVAAATHRKKN